MIRTARRDEVRIAEPARADSDAIAGVELTRWYWLLAALAAIALVVRLPLGLHAPPFVDLDTRQYLKPAFNLLAGQEFGLTLRRTPGYPAFLALALRLGADFRGILLLQHALGVGLALLTAEIGRLLYGRGVGLAAGLLIALSAPLLISEHYLLTETVFSLPLVAACWLALRALRGGREPWRPLLAAGLLLGVAALVRPVGQLLLPLPALACLLDGRGWRRALRVAGLVGSGGALVLCPWMAHNLARYSVFELTHATGEVLITHTALYARGRYGPPSSDGTEEPARAAARRLVEAATDGSDAKARAMYGPRIADELTRRLSLSPLAADDLLRDLAVEQIRAQPATYLGLLLENTWRVFAGRPADLGYAWESPASESWGPSLPIHPQPATDDQDAWREPLEALTYLYDPADLAVPIAFLFGLGLVRAGLDRRARLASLPALAAITLILAGVALVGVEYRFRYPADPLITVVALGGLRWLGARLPDARRLAPRRAAGGPRAAARMRPDGQRLLGEWPTIRLSPGPRCRPGRSGCPGGG